MNKSKTQKFPDMKEAPCSLGPHGPWQAERPIALWKSEIQTGIDMPMCLTQRLQLNEGQMKQLQTLACDLCQQVISTAELQNPVFMQVLLFLRGFLNKWRKVFLSEKKQNVFRARTGLMALNPLQSYVYLPAVYRNSNRKELVDQHLRS